MAERSRFSTSRWFEWGLISLAAVTLVLCLGYTMTHAFLSPYPGLDLDGRWLVVSTARCDDYPDWCQRVENTVQPGDRLLAIGDLSFEQFRQDPHAVPFAGYDFGEAVTIRLLRGVERQSVAWEMLPRATPEVWIRLLAGFLYLPFWVAGTLVLFFLRPRDVRWRLLILVFLLTSLWLATGSMYQSHIASSPIVAAVTAWLMVPAYVHLHLSVPTPLRFAWRRWAVGCLYAVFIGLAMAQLSGLLTSVAHFVGLLAAVGSSLMILLYRRLIHPNVSDRQATRWLIMGILFSFVPGVALFVVPNLVGSNVPRLWSNTIAAAAIPAFPGFYIYGIFKRQSSDLEFRANRILSLYSFVLLYASGYAVVFSLASRWWGWGDELVLFSLLLSSAFVGFAPSIKAAYQRVFDRLAYGTQHDANTIIRRISSRIPSAAGRRQLVRLIQDEIQPSLLIRQSALLVKGRDGSFYVLQLMRTGPRSAILDSQTAQELIERAGRYVSPSRAFPEPWSWVRLVVPLEVRGDLIGLWLFGRRDPDDFYPRADIELLDAVAHQVALAIQNAELLDEARQRAAQQEALNAIISTAAAVADFSQLLEVALDHSMEALGVPKGAAWLRALPVLYTRELPESFADTPAPRILTAGLSAQEISIVDDWDARLSEIGLPPHQSVPPDIGVRASICIPLHAEAEMVGGLALCHPEPRSWTKAERALASAIGKQLGAAIERVRLLEEIRQQAQQLERILTTVQEGILTLNEDRRVILANPVARLCLRALANADEGDVLDHLGDRPIGELLNMRTDGLPHEVVLADEQRVFEVLPSPATEELLGAQRTLLIREVTEARRVQSRAQQQDRLAAVGQLAAGIAHDFNNIMNAIILFGEMLLEEDQLSTKGRERLRTVIQQAQRATNLTRQILDFGRQTIMELVPINLTPFLREFRRLLERTLPESILFELDIQREDHVIRADPARIQQVFMNLALNARDSMHDGGTLRILVDEWSVDSGGTPPFRGMPVGNWVRVQVSDSGTGIATEDLPHIFEPFFTTKGPGQGTGLGLAQVYGIVKQHTGFIDVSSQLGGGTTFSIYLPALEVSPLPTELYDAHTPAQGQLETILVVEDEPATLRAVSEILRALNYKVYTAENGRQALELIDSGRGAFDLVLSDMIMPDMGGVDLYQNVTRRYPSIRLILMTGYPLGKDTRLLLDRERIKWVQKPLDSENLARIIRETLEGADGAGADSSKKHEVGPGDV